MKGKSIGEQESYIKYNWCKKIVHDRIGLEENSIKAVSKNIHEWKLPITLFWTGSKDPKTETFALESAFG